MATLITEGDILTGPERSRASLALNPSNSTAQFTSTAHLFSGPRGASCRYTSWTSKNDSYLGLETYGEEEEEEEDDLEEAAAALRKLARLPSYTVSADACTSLNPSSWNELELSCQKLDSEHIQISSLDLSNLEIDPSMEQSLFSPDVAYSNHGSTLGNPSILTTEAILEEYDFAQPEHQSTSALAGPAPSLTTQPHLETSATLQATAASENSQVNALGPGRTVSGVWNTATGESTRATHRASSFPGQQGAPKVADPRLALAVFEANQSPTLNTDKGPAEMPETRGKVKQGAGQKKVKVNVNNKGESEGQKEYRSLVTGRTVVAVRPEDKSAGMGRILRNMKALLGGGKKGR